MKEPRDVKILVADDFPQSLQLFSIILKKNFYCTVKTAADGTEAVNLAKNDSFDLIFMDIQMPNLDGREAIRIIRQQPSYADVPIIVITCDSQSRRASFEAGANDFMVKPIEPQEFVSRVHYYISSLPNLYRDKKPGPNGPT